MTTKMWSRRVAFKSCRPAARRIGGGVCSNWQGNRLAVALVLVLLAPVPAWSQQPPADPLYQGMLFLKKGQYANAIPKLRDATKATPASPEAWRFLGECAEALGLYQESLLAYTRFAGLRSEKTANLASHLTALKAMSDAVGLLETSLAKLTGPAGGSTAIATGAKVFAFPERLQSQLRDVGKDPLRPNHIAEVSVVMLAHFEFERAGFGECVKLLDSAPSARKSVAPCLTAFRHGLSALALGDWPRATRELAATLNSVESPAPSAASARSDQEAAWLASLRGLRPEGACVREALAAAHILWAKDDAKSGRWKDAQTRLRSAESILPGCAALALAECCEKTSSPQAAIPALRQALRGSLSSRAEIQERWAPAGPVGRRVIEALSDYPPNPGTLSEKLSGLVSRAVAMKLREEDFDEADAALREAFQLHESQPVPPEKREALAKELLREATDLLVLQKAPEAYAKLAEVTTCLDGTAAAMQARFHLGECFRQLRQWQRAAAAYRAFLQRYPHHELADDAHIGLVYLLGGQMGKPAEAVAECQRLMRAYPESPYAAEASYLRGMCYATQLNDNKRALNCFQETLDLYPQSFWATQWAPKRIEQVKKELGQAR